MARSNHAGALLAVGILLAALAGCADEPADPAALGDPCGLISDEMLARIAPGSTREPSQSGSGTSGSKQCAVDLTSGDGSLRGDLAVRVGVDGHDSFDEAWRIGRCDRIEARVTTDGPGDVSCMVVKPYANGEARIDGWAWVGDDYEAQVAYQLVDPQTLPPSAERDLRNLLAAAVDSLPRS
ncbi:hypothetical protein [Catellatospora methionotrophica]|uniref:hypothetical protein n=1 Tax=Catellatospora methionotrophica TaxID=121620 RepID=UPI0033CF676C